MINRELYMSRIRPFIGLDIIKVLTGLRRSGKSVMLELIKEELLRQGVTSAQFLSFNFEDMNNIPYCTAEALHDEIKKRVSAVDGKSYLFFDEIQEVRDWERCINSLRIELECDIYITGSNAKLLSGELATYLAGRYVEFVIYPFSYREFLMLYREIYPEATEQKVFSSYLTLGGSQRVTGATCNGESSDGFTFKPGEDVTCVAGNTTIATFNTQSEAARSLRAVEKVSFIPT